MRPMKCPHSMVNDVLTPDAGNGVHNVEWLVDLAFGVHPDLTSHVGRTMMFEGGRGSTVNILAKQKLNTKSLTVAESEGVDCMPPLALRAPPFLKEQGHNIKENIIEQDNKGTTSLDVDTSLTQL